MKSLYLYLVLSLVSIGFARAAEPPPLPPGAFTIVVIPDTQDYRGKGTKATPTSNDPLTNHVFVNHTQWIVDHLKSQNIVFVSHVGDIVDINNDAQWQLAADALAPLHGKVPYSLTVGNHDMTNAGDASRFQHHFPASRFREFPWYGGSYENAHAAQNVSVNNVNSYQLFTAGDMDFIHLSLECNAPDDVLAWAQEVVAKYPTRRLLVTTHMDLGPLNKPKIEADFIHSPKGRMRWKKIHGERGNTSEQLWDKFFKNQPNLGFIFSGDQSRTTAMRLNEKGIAGNTVHSLLSDYTSSGPLRLYRFIPSENEVQVITFDTTKREIVETAKYVPVRSEHQFVIPYSMK